MGLLDIFKRKKKQEVADIVESESDKIETGLNIVPSVDDEMVVLMEQLPSTYSLDDKSLIEISDSHVLAKIDGLVPSLNTAGVSVGNIIKTVREAQGDKLYKVVLKNGGELVDSRTMAGAKRAMTLGPNGIKENANLIEVTKGVDKGAVVANAGAAVMSVASMVVGQYYMRQVGSQLSLIGDRLSKVIEFLDVQYKSEVASLMESV